MGCLVVRIQPSGFYTCCVEARKRSEYRFLTLLRDLLWRDIDRLAEKTGRIAASLAPEEGGEGDE